VLGSAGIEFELAAEATGWEVLLELARVGVGVAIVNDFCRAPSGTVARPLGGFATTSYALIERMNAERSEAVERLRSAIVETLRQPKPNAAR
jgi:DNA-binding transcriptional LysR family regulator